MPRMPTERIKPKEDLLARLSAQGVELDTRQDGWPIVFGTFPVTDPRSSSAVGKMTNALKDHYILAAAGVAFDSKLTGLLYMPVICSIIVPPFVGTKLSHKRSENAVIVKVGIDSSEWMASPEKARRSLFVEPLVAALRDIRASWLIDADREQLGAIFRAFAASKPLARRGS